MIRVVPAILLSAGLFALNAQAASVNHGDFAAITVDYLQVTEDSGTDPLSVPLFGAPTVAGDALTFSPVGFNSSSTGAGGNDITDGTLQFMIDARPDSVIEKVSFDEAGDFTLLGFGGAGTFAKVTAKLFVSIVEVDNNSINPILIAVPLVFTPSNGDWDLLNDGPGPQVDGIWTGSSLVDLEAELVANQIKFRNGVTKVNVNLDNTLSTLSEDGTSAFIAKKNANGLSITVLPEPTVSLLMGLGLAALVLRRR